MAPSHAKLSNAQARMLRYEVLSEWHGLRDIFGAVAFSRIGDPASGEFADAILLKAFGEVPSDLSAL